MLRYYIAFVVNDATGESLTYPFTARRDVMIPEVMGKIRAKLQMEDAGITLYEIHGPPVESWELPPYVPVELTDKPRAVPMNADELQLHRLLCSSGLFPESAF